MQVVQVEADEQVAQLGRQAVQMPEVGLAKVTAGQAVAITQVSEEAPMFLKYVAAQVVHLVAVVQVSQKATQSVQVSLADRIFPIMQTVHSVVGVAPAVAAGIILQVLQLVEQGRQVLLLALTVLRTNWSEQVEQTFADVQVAHPLEQAVQMPAELRNNLVLQRSQVSPVAVEVHRAQLVSVQALQAPEAVSARKPSGQIKRQDGGVSTV